MTLTFRLVNGPAGMTIDPDTGALSWTPQGGPGTLRPMWLIQVEDEAGATDFGSFIADGHTGQQGTGGER
jgi:hypothetical protein